MATITLKRPVQYEVKYLKVNAGVRDWEDGEVNGQQDDNDDPKMPFAGKNGWQLLIDIDTGKIDDWPEGVTASTYYKVCDEGVYELLDAQMQVVAKHEGYVPAMMCPNENGYGDYIIMDVSPDGAIANWRIDFDKFSDEDDD